MVRIASVLLALVLTTAMSWAQTPSAPWPAAPQAAAPQAAAPQPAAPEPGTAPGTTPASATGSLSSSAQASASGPNAPSAPPYREPTAEERQHARAQATQAQTLMRHGDYTGAKLLLEASLALDPRGTVLLSLVKCYRELGENANAHTLLLKARTSGVPALSAWEASEVETQLAELQGYTARLRLIPPPAPLTLTLNGRALTPPAPGQAIVLEPGVHRIHVSKPEFEEYDQELSLVAGADVTHTITLQPVITTGHVEVKEQHGYRLTVTIDGKAAGPAPWQGDLPAGTYTIGGEGPRVNAAPATVELPRRGSVLVTLVGVILREHVTVTADAPNATATLDGLPITLPFEQTVSLGMHRLSVSAPGRDPVEKDFVLSADKPVVEHITLPASRPVEAVADTDDSPLHLGALIGLLSLPRPINGEAQLKITDFFGVGVNYTLLPKITYQDASLSTWALQGIARVYPFGGAFYVGAGIGRQSLHASGEDAPFHAEVDVASLFVNPQVGFLWVLKAGLALNVGLGVHIPIGAKPEIVVSDSTGRIPPAAFNLAAQRLRDDVEAVSRLIAETPLPAVDLLKVGFFF